MASHLFIVFMQLFLQPSRGQPGGAMVGGNSGQKPVIQQMIDGVNRFQLPNILYQNEVRMFAFKNRFSSSTYQAGMLSNRELVLLPYPNSFVLSCSL